MFGDPASSTSTCVTSIIPLRLFGTQDFSSTSAIELWDYSPSHTSRHPLLSPVGQQRHPMVEVNVRDEGFTVLSGGVEPVAESVRPP
jgi:hypothetical protein